MSPSFPSSIIVVSFILRALFNYFRVFSSLLGVCLETLDGVATIIFFHLHVFYALPFPLLYDRVVKAVGLSWCFGCESLGGG